MPPQNTPEALLERATWLRRSGRAHDAIAAYRHLLGQRPELPDSWYHLGFLQQQVGNHEAALDAYGQALAHGVRDPEEVHLNRSTILATALARPDEARQELDAALRLNPRYTPAWLNLGNLHEQRGDAQAAVQAYERVLALKPEHALALSRLPSLQRVESADDPLIARLRGALRRPAISLVDQADLGFGLGKALDDAHAYDEAFAAYSAANQASREVAADQGLRYDPSAHERLVDELIAAFPPPAGSPEPVSTTPGPIFVCGMFRSGSTLVEQILARHPEVTAGGEMGLLPALAREHLREHGGTFRQLDDAAVQSLRTRYLHGVAARYPGARIVTDKRPDNFLLIGLIKRLFPAAKIVHTTREPLDNCLAIYFLHLTRAMPYAFALQDIAHWYRHYRRLMAHWQLLYGNDIVELHYDTLVQDPRPTIEALLAHVALPWADTCLNFSDTRAVVATASLWQVRQPLYRSSSGRWTHYERHLQPLRAALAGISDR